MSKRPSCHLVEPQTPLRGLLVVALTACAACAQGGEALPPSSTPAASPPKEAPAPTTAPVPITGASAMPVSVSPSTAATQAPAAAPAAPASGPPKDLNVLLITVDSMRADMPWLGYARPIAPVMTAFAKTAVSYARFYAISSYTAMSLGGLLAARYPSEVTRSGYFFGSYPDSVLMFPELLQKAGVRTLSAQAHFYFDRAGFKQGFDVYQLIPKLDENNKTDKNITSPQHLELAKKILGDKANTQGRFFAWFHLMDPHDVYMPHDGIGPYGKDTRDKYDAEITFTDQHIGKLLEYVEAQDWGKRTAVIISADHGEAFGEHKQWRHGFELWDVVTHVPLMIRAPGITPRQIDATRSAIDLGPTILELFGVPKDPAMVGTSLVPELYGKDEPSRDVITDLPRTSDNDRRRTLLRGDHKIIVEGDDEGFRFFNLKDDPGEEHDLKRKEKAKFEEMKAAYKQHGKKIPSICPQHREKLKGKKKNKPC